eukprot:scaffold102907_cov34-Tisochrysis_lutea.AAC.1
MIAAHHPVSGIEGLLDSITMVDVDVEIEHARVVLQQMQDSKHNVIDVAEPGCLGSLRMVQPACPIDGNVGRACIKSHGTIDRTSRIQATIVVQPIKHRAVIAWLEQGTRGMGARVAATSDDPKADNALRSGKQARTDGEALQLLGELMLRVRRDAPQEVHVPVRGKGAQLREPAARARIAALSTRVVQMGLICLLCGVELQHLLVGRKMRPADLHLAVEVVGEDEVVRHRLWAEQRRSERGVEGT